MGYYRLQYLVIRMRSDYFPYNKSKFSTIFTPTMTPELMIARDHYLLGLYVDLNGPQYGFETTEQNQIVCQQFTLLIESLKASCRDLRPLNIDHDIHIWDTLLANLCNDQYFWANTKPWYYSEGKQVLETIAFYMHQAKLSKMGVLEPKDTVLESHGVSLLAFLLDTSADEGLCVCCTGVQTHLVKVYQQMLFKDEKTALLHCLVTNIIEQCIKEFCENYSIIDEENIGNEIHVVNAYRYQFLQALGLPPGIDDPLGPTSYPHLDDLIELLLYRLSPKQLLSALIESEDLVNNFDTAFPENGSYGRTQDFMNSFHKLSLSNSMYGEEFLQQVTLDYKRKLNADAQPFYTRVEIFYFLFLTLFKNFMQEGWLDNSFELKVWEIEGGIYFLYKNSFDPIIWVETFENPVGFLLSDVAMQSMEMRQYRTQLLETVCDNDEIDLNLVLFITCFGVHVETIYVQNILLYFAAISFGFLPLVQVMHAQGIDLRQMDPEGNTALHYAAKNGKREVLEYLLMNGLQDLCNYSNLEGKTALDEALNKGYYLLVDPLIKAGASIPAEVCDFEMTETVPLLMIAVRYACYDLVQTLLERGESISVSDNQGKTLLHWAALNQDYDMVNQLLRAGANMTAIDYTGNNSLHDVFNNEYSDTDNLKRLLHLMVPLVQDVNFLLAKNTDGNSVLSLAGEEGTYEIMNVILEKIVTLLSVNVAEFPDPVALSTLAGVRAFLGDSAYSFFIDSHLSRGSIVHYLHSHYHYKEIDLPNEGLTSGKKLLRLMYVHQVHHIPYSVIYSGCSLMGDQVHRAIFRSHRLGIINAVNDSLEPEQDGYSMG